MTSEKQTLLDITATILRAIHSGDVDTYRSLSVDELSCYETDVAPYRIDTVDFHIDLMTAMRERGAYGPLVRFDMLTPRVQVYGDSAIVTYTRLMTYVGDSGPRWQAFNESRVFARIEGEWKMVHFHRSHAAV